MTREHNIAERGREPACIPSTFEMKACYQRHMLYGTLISCLLIVLPTLVWAYWPDGGTGDRLVPPEPPDSTKVDTVFISATLFDEFEVVKEQPIVGPPPGGAQLPPEPGDNTGGEIVVIDDSTFLTDEGQLGGWGSEVIGPDGDDDWNIFDGPGGGVVFVPDTTSEFHLLDEVDRRPDMIDMPKPQYPSLAQKAGIEGLVVLHVLVDIDGSARKVMVYGERPEGFRFGEFAARAANEAVFAPAINGRQPVRCWVSFTVKFELE
ncbi:MAG: energy transducer TonB [bacterium]